MLFSYFILLNTVTLKYDPQLLIRDSVKLYLQDRQMWVLYVFSM